MAPRRPPPRRETAEPVTPSPPPLPFPPLSQVLPSLGSVPPEAPLNLVVYHLKNGELKEAYELVKGLTPATPQEYIIKAIVHASLGQAPPASLGQGAGGGLPAAEHIKLAQQFFQLVGSSASEVSSSERASGGGGGKQAGGLLG